jgi:O-antigen/teichoic acid export membrane protein
MGPFLVVFMGISLVTVPEASRILRRSPRHLRLYCIVLGVALSVLALVWGIALVIALPKGLGHLLLGSLWKPAAALVPALTISVMGACITVGATAGLHALGAARRSLRAMVLASLVYLACGLIGAFADGAAGTVRGAALATWIGASLWWWQLSLGLRESELIPDHHGLLRVLARFRRQDGVAQEPQDAEPQQADPSRTFQPGKHRVA